MPETLSALIKLGPGGDYTRSYVPDKGGRLVTHAVDDTHNGRHRENDAYERQD